jgi:hypothetical protein
VADIEGRINNFIDVSDFKAFNEDSSTLDIAKKEDEVRVTTPSCKTLPSATGAS